MKPPFFLLTGAALSLLFGTPAGADTPHYRLTVLPLDFSGYNMIDVNTPQGGINAQGQVVGMASVRSGGFRDDRAALWQMGHSLRVLDKHPVTDPNATSGQDFLYPTAINRRGMATGTRTLSYSGAYSVNISTAYLLWNGLRKDLSREILTKAEMASAALGLNDQGDIVGGFVYDDTDADAATDSSPPPGTESRHAFVRHNEHIMPLWPGVARGINNHGWIVGVRDVDGEDSHARGVLWRSGKVTLFKMQPTAINEHGEIAGNLPVTEDNDRACLWRQGHITYLSKQISHAYGLNNRGDVVGEWDHAVLWRDGRTYDLNRCVSLPKGWVLEKAIGINDHGWIIGEGCVYKTPKDKQALKSFTFLLTPK